LFGRRWTLPLLAELDTADRRYQDFHDALEGISHKVLTDTLRRAERDGLIVRHLDSGAIKPTTLYRLSDIGRSLDEPLVAVGHWVDDHWGVVNAARENWDRRRKTSE